MRKNRKETILTLQDLQTINHLNRENVLSREAIKIIQEKTKKPCKRFVKRNKNLGILIVETVDGEQNGVKRDQLLNTIKNRPFVVSEQLLEKVRQHI